MAIVLARGSRLMDLHGIGPVVAARVLADTGDVIRTAERNRFASWTGTTTAPGISVGSSTASSGTPPLGPWGCGATRQRVCRGPDLVESRGDRVGLAGHGDQAFPVLLADRAEATLCQHRLGLRGSRSASHDALAAERPMP